MKKISLIWLRSITFAWYDCSAQSQIFISFWILTSKNSSFSLIKKWNFNNLQANWKINQIFGKLSEGIIYWISSVWFELDFLTSSSMRNSSFVSRHSINGYKWTSKPKKNKIKIKEVGCRCTPFTYQSFLPSQRSIRYVISFILHHHRQQ